MLYKAILFPPPLLLVNFVCVIPFSYYFKITNIYIYAYIYAYMCSPSKCPVCYSDSHYFFFNICQKLFTASGSHFVVNFTLNCVDLLMH